MSVRSRLMLPLALGALTSLVIAASALASHPRPQGASPIRISYVPSFKQCTSPNSTHGAPLAVPSCNPPDDTSDFLTTGTPDANGLAAKGVAFSRIIVVPGNPATATDEADVRLEGRATDVRCKGVSGGCSGALADYTGSVKPTAVIRITDHFNDGPPPDGTFVETATVADLPFPVETPCTATADTTIGSTCEIFTTADAVVPDVVKENKRSTVEISQIIAEDGGADGQGATDPNTVYGVQGIFIP